MDLHLKKQVLSRIHSSKKYVSFAREHCASGNPTQATTEILFNLIRFNCITCYTLYDSFICYCNEEDTSTSKDKHPSQVAFYKVNIIRKLMLCLDMTSLNAMSRGQIKIFYYRHKENYRYDVK